MEADWLRTYSRDLREDLFGERWLGARRLRALIYGLPPDAMVWRREPGWGSVEELLALNAEVAHSTTRVLLSAFSKKGASQPKALKVPRPYDARAAARRPRNRRPVTEADLAGYGGSVTRIGHAAPNGSEAGV